MSANEPRLKTPQSKRRLIVLFSALALVLLFFRPAQNRLGELLALRSEVMSQNWFHDLVSASSHPRKFIVRAWDTGRVPHRYEVLSLLNDFGATNVLAPADFERIVASALAGPDESERELAFSILLTRNDRNAITDAALRQLRDVDPQVRSLGIRALRASDPKRAQAALVALLKDPDAFFAGSALMNLQALSGQDFGLRLGRSTNELHAAIERADAWWSTNQARFATKVTMTPLPPEPGVAVSDFTLADLDGKPVRLSDYRGETVLLNFWTTWCGACRSEFPTLNELQARHPNDFAILAISLDGANGETFKDSAEKPGAADQPADLADIRKEVLRVAKTQKLGYKILLDPTSKIGGRFNGGALPTNVLIDGEGRLRRRFIGTRELETLEAMLREIQSH